MLLPRFLLAVSILSTSLGILSGAEPIYYAEEAKEGGIVLKLGDDNSFWIGPTGETGGQHQSGSYTLSEDTIILTVEKNEPSDYRALNATKVIYRKVNLPNSLFSTTGISAPGEISLIAVRAIPKPGEKRDIKGVRVLTTGFVQMIPTDNVKVRTGPSRSFPFNDRIYIDGTTRDVVSYLPKGYEVTSIAKTTAEEVIDGVKAPWHYCRVITGWYDTGPRFGWIFGGYLILK